MTIKQDLFNYYIRAMVMEQKKLEDQLFLSKDIRNIRNTHSHIYICDQKYVEWAISRNTQKESSWDNEEAHHQRPMIVRVSQ